MKKSNILLLFPLVLLCSCLQTRSKLRSETGTIPKESTITPKQQKVAEQVIQQEETNKEFRELYGRIEFVENQLNQVKENEKIKFLEARIAQMETEMNLLRTTISDLNAKAKKDAALLSSDERAAQAKPIEKSELSEASKHFDSKKWEDAILAFEEYRKNNPKGKSYPEATLKIGICFQNMGLKEDAKAFYKEVVNHYPNSKEAETAKSKLKKL